MSFIFLGCGDIAAQCIDFYFSLPHKKNTISAVRSGFYWGYIGLVQSIINKITKQTKKKYNIVITGGFSELFFNSLNFKAVIDKEITMKGLQKIIKTI